MRYDLPTEKLGASSPMRAPEVHAPEIKDYASEQMKTTGDALTKGGLLMSVMAENHENDLAEAATRQRINGIETGLQKLLLDPDAGYMKKLGESAVKDTDVTIKAVDEMDKTFASECKTDLEKGLYNRHATKLFKAAKDHIFMHSIGQAKVWNTMEAKTSTGNAQKEVIEAAATFKDKPLVSGPKTFTPVGLTSPNLDDQQKAVIQRAREQGIGGIAHAETGHIPSLEARYAVDGKPTKYGTAHGMYQILDTNWDKWSKMAGLPDGAKPTPENQDYVASFHWLRILDKFGGDKRLAAIAWNAGETRAETVRDGDSGPLYYKNDPKNPNSTVANYVAKATGAMGVEQQTPHAAAEEKMKSRIRDMARAAGIVDTNSEAYKNIYDEVVSNTRAGAVIKLLESDDTAPLAKEYYAKYRDEMSVERRKEIQPKLNHYEGDAYAKKLWDDQKGNITINQGPNLDMMYKAIDANSALDRDAKDIAKARINHLKGQYEAAKSEQEKSLSMTVFGMVNKNKPYPDILKYVKETTQIDEQSRANLLSYVAGAYGMEAEVKSEFKLKSQAELLKFQEEYADGKHGRMEPGDVTKMAPKLGPYTDNAMQFVYHANAMAGNVKIPMDDLKNRLRILKRNPAYDKVNIPDPDSSDSTNKANLAILQSKVLQLMASTAKAGGKPMTVDAALDKYLQMVVYEKNTIFPDTTMNLYKTGTKGYEDVSRMTPEAKKAFAETEYLARYGRNAPPGVIDNLIREMDKPRKK